MKAVKRLGLVALGAVVLAGCGAGGGSVNVSEMLRCPAASLAGWQRLANRIQAPVYCPTWMPNPLDGRIGGQWTDVDSVSRDRSYLISFLWHEKDSGDVHVNFRGYPGRTGMPTCRDLATNKKVPCFSDPHGTKEVAGLHVTMYTANQGADMWHVLYAWRFRGSLYAVSEHVTPPLTYTQVRKNLDRLLHGLVRIEPRT
jgi:hypothetical protein